MENDCSMDTMSRKEIFERAIDKAELHLRRLPPGESPERTELEEQIKLLREELRRTQRK